MRPMLWMLSLLLTCSPACAQWQMRILPSTPNPSPPTSELVTLTIEQAKALLKIAEERRLCNELVDKLTADLADIERRAASTEAGLTDIEARAERIQQENAALADLLAQSQAQVKQIEKKERARRIRWLLYGLASGAVMGFVAAR